MARRQVSVKPRRHRAASSSQQLRAQVVRRLECSAAALGIAFDGSFFFEQPADVTEAYTSVAATATNMPSSILPSSGTEVSSTPLTWFSMFLFTSERAGNQHHCR